MDFGTERRDRPMPVQISSAEMIRYRDERRPMQFMLSNGQLLEGAVSWFDDYTFHVVGTAAGDITLFKHSVIYYRPL